MLAAGVGSRAVGALGLLAIWSHLTREKGVTGTWPGSIEFPSRIADTIKHELYVALICGRGQRCEDAALRLRQELVFAHCSGSAPLRLIRCYS